MRPIKIAPQEIVDRIRKSKVVKMKQLVENLECSVWTLFDKLREYGYYTSYNFNGQYITLKEIPLFDDNGIWEYKQARFSKWRNVEETICHIVDKSPAGLTPIEITEILQIRTHNQLLKCRRKGLLISKRYGRSQVYYSVYEETQKHQMKEREAMMKRSPTPIKLKPLSDKTIIDILLVMLKHHETKPENIISILASEGKKISERSIKWVIEEYEIEKKGSLFKS